MSPVAAPLYGIDMPQDAPAQKYLYSLINRASADFISSYFVLKNKTTINQLFLISIFYLLILRISNLLRFYTMGSTALPYIQTKPKIIFFTDFDGTITMDDSELPVGLD